MNLKGNSRKTQYQLLPFWGLKGPATALMRGSKKYAPWNWYHRRIPWSRYYGSTLRHLFHWWWGEERDPETRLSNLWHAASNLAILIHIEAERLGQDDRPRHRKKVKKT